MEALRWTTFDKTHANNGEKLHTRIRHLAALHSAVCVSPSEASQLNPPFAACVVMWNVCVNVPGPQLAEHVVFWPHSPAQSTPLAERAIEKKMKVREKKQPHSNATFQHKGRQAVSVPTRCCTKHSQPSSGPNRGAG